MKLITFGCSFSSYGWPTWADIIAEDLGIQHENWAMGGMGNQGISKRVMSKHLTTGFDPDDLVIVQWSFSAREDRFLENKWQAKGNVFSEHTIYGKKFVDKYWDPLNDAMNTLHAQLFVKNLITNKKFFQFRVLDKMTEHMEYFETNDNPELMELLTSHMDMPTFTNTDIPFDGHNLVDRHPDPRFWLNYVKTVIYPQFGFTLKQSTIDKTLDYQRELTEFIKDAYAKNQSYHQRTFSIHTEADRLSKKYWNLNKIPAGDMLLNKKIHF